MINHLIDASGIFIDETKLVANESALATQDTLAWLLHHQRLTPAIVASRSLEQRNEGLDV
jgi:hypothetical protein